VSWESVLESVTKSLTVLLVPLHKTSGQVMQEADMERTNHELYGTLHSIQAEEEVFLHVLLQLSLRQTH